MPEITKNKIIQKSLVSKHTFQMVKLLLITKNYIYNIGNEILQVISKEKRVLQSPLQKA